MIPTEIERKFVINQLPENIESIKKITQKHIYRDLVCSIRVRRSEDLTSKKIQCTHTIKAKGEEQQKYSIYELERSITEAEFNEFKPYDGSKLIEKYRCIIPIENDLKVELDIFGDWMKGLIVAEVEFKNLEDAENFKLPEWFEKEKNHTEFSNRKLSTKTREELLEMIGEEQLKKNEKILNEFEAKYKI